MDYKKINEKEIKYEKLIFILLSLPCLFLLTGIGHTLSSGNLYVLTENLKSILLSQTILFTDFIELGGVEAALINVALVALVNIYLIYLYRLEVNGIVIAGFFTVIGFSFFGKNLYNIFSIYIGGYLYTKYKKITMKDVIAPLMFGTALAPVVSEISFAGFLPSFVSSTVATLVGVFVGFVIVPLSSHMLKFHEGYNLYNIGFTAGIIGTLLTACLRSFGVTVEPVSIISDSNERVIISLLLVSFFSLFALGLYINSKALKKYKRILSYSGRLITDYTNLVGYGITFINMALLGLLSLGYVILIGGAVNGPVLAGIFTIVGFAAFGKHIKNCLPVVSGTIASAILFGFELSETAIIVSVLFSTTLAPIAGKFGLLAGFVAGLLHMALVTNVGVIHGGINLYNNGFSGGIVASVMVPIMEAFKKVKIDDKRI